ncbi:MAG TPA: outer membrane protein transport protein [Phenylobacterium sp.]|jgi:long-chain fatty acid transport protein|nr:outer membrane protein transport protein [Phenylobacterium sp.]
MKFRHVLASSSVAFLTAASAAHAGGFYLQEQSVRGTGRAYSGEVSDQGVESLWWNPAAIADSPREVYVGANGIFVDAKVKNQGSTITYPGGTTAPIGGNPTAKNPIQDGLAPNFAIATPLGDRFAVGLSVAAPYNFITKYQPDAWTRYDALTSRLTTADVQLTGAMKVTDWLNVGVSFDSEYTSARLVTAQPNLSPALPDGMSQLRGDGWNYGYSVGAQGKFDRLTLGASYRSAMDHDLNGNVSVSGLLGPLAAGNANLSGRASFTTPWIATFGGRYQVNDKLTLDAQVQRFGWSEFKSINVNTAAGAQVLPQNYQDTTSGGAGFDYKLNPKLTLRAGVQYDPTPTPNVGRMARVPDGDRWLFGAGGTADLNDHMKLDLAVAYIDFANSTVNDNPVFYASTPAATSAALRGQVQGEGYVVSVGLRTRF